MKAKSPLTSICLVAAGMLSAATLNVELDIMQGVYSGGELVTSSRKVVFLVIDRSYSMCLKSLKGSEGPRSPDEALFESLTMQLDSIPSGTEVHVLPFSSRIGEEVVFKSLDDASRKSIIERVKNMKPKGQTVLYDAQDMALSAAAKIMTSDNNAEVRVLVYTDGEHLTPPDYEGEYKARYQLRDRRIGRKGYIENPSYQEEREAARNKFERKFSDLRAKPNLEVEYEWLSASKAPDWAPPINKTAITPVFSASVTSLKNPLSQPEQSMTCKLHLPISDKCWEQVKGKQLSLDFDVEGKRTSAIIKLEKGKQVCKLDWPSLPSDKSAIAKLVFSRMPSGEKFFLKPPRPKELFVPAQDRTSVVIDKPSKGAVVPVGANVSFVARASEGATVKWSIGNDVLMGPSVSWQAKAPGRTAYRATASKVGSKEAFVSDYLEVIPTGVKIECSAERLEVGKEIVFRASSVGPCQGYAWTVDGMRVPGETGILKHVFKNSGVHHVGVTARYKGGIAKEAEPLRISVSVAPLIEVILPMVYDEDANNTHYQARSPIPLLARVEGDLTNVVWQFKLTDEAVEVQTMVKGGKASGNYTLQKGGYYDVTATAKGPAGEKSSTVQIFVKSMEVQVDIKDPKPNQGIETDKEFDLIADVKGPVKSVRWKIIDQATAKNVPFGPSDVSPVRDGQTSIKAKLPIEVCNTSLDVVAEPVFDEKDRELAESVISSKVVIQAKTDASINYTQETQLLHWKRVKYGSQVSLAVETTGAIQKVAWFTFDADGNEKNLGKDGKLINVDIPFVKGKKECPLDYLAKGLMPDGQTWMPVGQRITLVAEKENLVAVIDYRDESYYTINGNLELSSKASTGKIVQRIWMENGRIVSTNEKYTVEFPGIPCEKKVTLEIHGCDGDIASVETKDLRVRFGWWAIIIIFFGGVLLLVIPKRFLLGNEVLNMTVQSCLGPAPAGKLNELLDSVNNPNVSPFKFNKVSIKRKLWTILQKAKKGKGKPFLASVLELLQPDADEETYDPILVKRFGVSSLTFYVFNGVPKVDADTIFVSVTPRRWQMNSPMEQAEEEPNTRIVVLMDQGCNDKAVSCLYILMRPGSSHHWTALCFGGLLIVMLFLVFHMCVKFAV